MNIINKTMIKDSVIQAILQDLGLTEASISITIQVGGIEDLGLCQRKGSDYLVSMAFADIETLAHELKHVEQYNAGLGAWIKAEQDLTKYDEQWHEIEANEYASKWG